MVSEIRYNRSCYHLADNEYNVLCGRKNLLMRDYVELQEGKINMIGEAKQVLETIDNYNICKQCLRQLK
jgi:hypothetical protein